jgi:hypothetical protein
MGCANSKEHAPKILLREQVDRSLEIPFLDALAKLGYDVDYRRRYGTHYRGRVAYRARKPTERTLDSAWIDKDAFEVKAMLGLRKRFRHAGIGRVSVGGGADRECYFTLSDDNGFTVCEVRLWPGLKPYPEIWRDNLRPQDDFNPQAELEHKKKE